MAQFYLPASGGLFTEETLQQNTGFPPTAAPSALAANGIYTVTPSPDPYDPLLYTSEPTFVIAGDYALESWVATPRPLPTAQNYATGEVKTTANTEISNIVFVSGYSAETLAAAGAALEVDRPATYQTVIAEQQVVTDNLAIQVGAIAAATTVDEINNIVNKPTGVLFTGRGSGFGPLDLNVSYYNAFNSVSMTEAETELFVPGTSTVISYGSGGPNAFDSAGNCFVLGDYLLQIREVATGSVIAEFECPLNPAGENVSFNGGGTPPTPLSVTSGSISGTAQVGSTLTYTSGVTSGGTSPITTAWAWKSGTTTVGTPSASTYVPVAGDVGSVVTVVITATDYTLNTASATTAPTAAVTYSSTTFNVTNNGSGNYVINGASNPTLTLAGGITYTFNISAPGHPFWIKTTQTTGTGNQYNTGVTNNGTDNGVITFVAPTFSGDPFTLYYNCQYHASMAGVLNMVP